VRITRKITAAVQNFTTIDPNIPSCAYRHIGHFGDEFGSPHEPIHWTHVVQHLDRSQACLDRKCDNTVSYCCFSRFLHVFVWYIDALRRHNVDHILSCGSLIGALRSGSMPPTHFDAEVHVFLRDDEDRAKMERIAREADDETEHVLVRRYGNWLFTDDYVRVDTYGFTKVTSLNSAGEQIWTAKPADNEPESFNVPERILFPTTKCNIYGIVIPCPAKPVEYLANTYHENDDASWWFPTEITSVTSYIHDTIDTDKYLAPGDPGFQLLMQAHLPTAAASMQCLYDQGYASLFDTWDTLTNASRQTIIEGAYGRFLPINLETGGLLPRNAERYAVTATPDQASDSSNRTYYKDRFKAGEEGR